jgi:hypothetical protein
MTTATDFHLDQALILEDKRGIRAIAMHRDPDRVWKVNIVCEALVVAPHLFHWRLRSHLITGDNNPMIVDGIARKSEEDRTSFSWLEVPVAKMVQRKE